MKNVFETLATQRILPLITKIDIPTAEIIVEAAHLAGIKTLEYAARSADAPEVLEAILKQVKAKGYDLLIGVGSVLNAAHAKLYHELGADYIVSPHIEEEVGKYCKEHDVFWIPGASTLNEAVYATKLGAGIVKLFPADYLGGPGFIKAISSPFPTLKLMPSGGVTTEAENLKSWFDAGVVCVGIGSNLFSAELLKTATVASVKARFDDLLNILEQLK
ncbi:keto-hydroxyglutarate-aldolase/keto-deoxy-phosphogluconate aldolase [Pedobacter sp. BAL39]|uniref:bifunctional 4-hydroxy-2-oxoglutarate aldolase/2-dehydro-3-deoxy-phosphogluconate aldolase n=1 Tax=Pedobacter sp. BAL39 TaxID=391596 RepID=UPI0001559322|nr:aldolase [Pedobacter sp. BAL39]EDM36049.1 keto-hydroxyglutarate-aldolase/keto-deoxy-phosphogluconate aldolase [Pedobacter sp. BAL39]